MPQCTACDQPNIADSIYCNKCGALLDNTITVPQRAIIAPPDPPPTSDDIRALLGLNEDHTYFGPDSRVVLLARGYPAPIAFSVRYESGLILGRLSTQLVERPLVDLTVFGGYKLGVSRMHAELVLRGHSLRLVDLGSTNGTFVNGTRLLPREQRGLNNGDTLQLGNLIMRVVFRHQS